MSTDDANSSESITRSSAMLKADKLSKIVSDCKRSLSVLAILGAFACAFGTSHLGALKEIDHAKNHFAQIAYIRALAEYLTEDNGETLLSIEKDPGWFATATRDFFMDDGRLFYQYSSAGHTRDNGAIGFTRHVRFPAYVLNELGERAFLQHRGVPRNGLDEANRELRKIVACAHRVKSTISLGETTQLESLDEVFRKAEEAYLAVVITVSPNSTRLPILNTDVPLAYVTIVLESVFFLFTLHLFTKVRILSDHCCTLVDSNEPWILIDRTRPDKVDTGICVAWYTLAACTPIAMIFYLFVGTQSVTSMWPLGFLGLLVCVFSAIMYWCTLACIFGIRNSLYIGTTKK